MITVVALASSMATQPAPGLLTHQFTTWDVFSATRCPTLRVSRRF